MNPRQASLQCVLYNAPGDSLYGSLGHFAGFLYIINTSANKLAVTTYSATNVQDTEKQNLYIHAQLTYVIFWRRQDKNEF